MPKQASDGFFLLADVGGTNTRPALKRPGAPAEQIRSFRNRDFPDLLTLLQQYLQSVDAEGTVTGGALAIACPIEGDRISLTNINWTFSTEALRRDLGLQTLRIFNDFTAVALALPALGDHQREQIGPGVPHPNEALAVLGPGTGLGVSGLIPCGNTWAPLASEGGHMTLAPATDEESSLFALLRPALKHVSAEKLLSGPGLIQLYLALGELRGAPVEDLAAETITARALDGSDPLAADALDTFFALLGGFAGDVALTIGARGGVFLAGGILPILIEPLKRSAFRTRFAAKGRFSDYLEAIPTYVITDPYPGLTGLGACVDKQAAPVPEPRTPSPESRST